MLRGELAKLSFVGKKLDWMGRSNIEEYGD
jgi:hypothetical protein